VDSILVAKIHALYILGYLLHVLFSKTLYQDRNYTNAGRDHTGTFVVKASAVQEVMPSDWV